MSIIPKSKPQMTRQEVLDLITKAYPEFIMPDFFICGIRGYYKNTMGAINRNDRAMYDDAIFLIGKDEFYSFNGNTDPAAFRHSIATLKDGVWNSYMFGRHKGIYMALVQRGGKVTVFRDGREGEFSGYFGINIHHGGIHVTSSEGCQTLPPTQWNNFIQTAIELAKRYYKEKWETAIYTYVLIEV